MRMSPSGLGPGPHSPDSSAPGFIALTVVLPPLCLLQCLINHFLKVVDALYSPDDSTVHEIGRRALNIRLRRFLDIPSDDAGAPL